MRPFRLALLMLALAVLFGPSSARAVSVSIVPSDTTVSQGDTLTVRVVCTAFADLKGYQLVHGLDPAYLTPIAQLPGDVLTGTGRAYAAFPLADVTAPIDSLQLDAAMLDGSTSGPGVLEYITLVAREKGTTTIVCYRAEFRDSSNAWTYPDCAGATIKIVGPTPVRTSTWGSLKATYR